LRGFKKMGSRSPELFYLSLADCHGDSNFLSSSSNYGSSPPVLTDDEFFPPCQSFPYPKKESLAIPEARSSLGPLKGSCSTQPLGHSIFFLSPPPRCLFPAFLPPPLSVCPKVFQASSRAKKVPMEPRAIRLYSRALPKLLVDF